MLLSTLQLLLITLTGCQVLPFRQTEKSSQCRAGSSCSLRCKPSQHCTAGQASLPRGSRVRTAVQRSESCQSGCHPPSADQSSRRAVRQYHYSVHLTPSVHAKIGSKSDTKIGPERGLEAINGAETRSIRCRKTLRTQPRPRERPERPKRGPKSPKTVRLKILDFGLVPWERDAEVIKKVTRGDRMCYEVIKGD